MNFRTIATAFLCMVIGIVLIACQPAGAEPTAVLPTPVPPTSTYQPGPTATSPLPEIIITPARPLAEHIFFSPYLTVGRIHQVTTTSTHDNPTTMPDGTVQYQVKMVTWEDGQEITILEEWRPAGLGFTVPVGVAWHPDSNGFYYTNLPAIDGAPYFVNGWDLWQFTLDGGHKQIITEADGGPSLALSNGLEYAAVGRGAQLTIRNLATEEVQQFTIPQEGTIGMMDWDDNDQRLLILVRESSFTTFALYQFTLVDGQLEPLFTGHDKHYIYVWWRENEAILTTIGNKMDIFNVATGEFQ